MPRTPPLKAPSLVDPFGRRITYLRLSVIDRCDLRCHYCMGEDVRFVPKPEVLSLEELERLSAAFIRLGVRKLRLTGGEPLIRRDVGLLIGRLGEHVAAGRLDELTLTTNGTLLAKHAPALAAAGMRRINVSLDTLDPATFRHITRRGELGPVLDGIAAAKAAGLAAKINAVALRGINEDHLDDLVAWCGRMGHDLTLIEAMPLGDFAASHHIPLRDIRWRLQRRWTLVESDHRSGGPARYVTVAETGRRLGFISAVSDSFCDGCNRVRLTCTGRLTMCLGRDGDVDLRDCLRSTTDDAVLERAIAAAIATKPGSHDFAVGRGRHRSAVTRQMNVTGG